jgi:putative membrane protein
MDGAYGGAAVVLLIVGFLRVFYTEKGAAYYFGSGPFLVKIVLFAVVGVISIGPTREYLSWRSALRLQQIPVLEDARRRSIRRAIHIQLTLLVAIMLCAALMARGIGFVG